jgi:hypothetical protein
MADRHGCAMKLLITAAVFAAGALIVEATDYALAHTEESDSAATLGFRTLYCSSTGKAETGLRL